LKESQYKYIFLKIYSVFIDARKLRYSYLKNGGEAAKKLSYIFLKEVIQFCFLGQSRISGSSQINHSLNNGTC